jgi:hypothetical protein
MVEERIEGVTINPFHIIDVCLMNRGRDAVLDQIADAKGGDVLKVFGPDKIIVDTEYYEPNLFIGAHQVSVRYFTDYLELEYGLIFEYWVKEEDGTEYMALSVDVPYNNDISPYFGNGCGFNYFSENKQHRFVIKSSFEVPEDNYVAVDWIKLAVISEWTTTSDKIYATDGKAPAILQIANIPITITGNGSNYKYSTIVNLGFTPEVYTVKTSNDGDSAGETIGTVTSYDESSFVATFTDIQHVNWSGTLTFNFTLEAFVPMTYI